MVFSGQRHFLLLPPSKEEVMLSGLSVSLLDYSKSYEQAQGPSDEILVAKKYYFDGNLDLGPDPEIFLKDIYIL